MTINLDADYREKVGKYIQSHSDKAIIQKLKTNKPVTRAEIIKLEDMLFNSDEVGTQEQYMKAYNKKPVGILIRETIGLDRRAVTDVFFDYIQTGNLNPDQMSFLIKIMNYLTVKGVLEKETMVAASFTNLHERGILGLFGESNANKVIQIIDKLNSNAIGCDD